MQFNPTNQTQTPPSQNKTKSKTHSKPSNNFKQQNGTPTKTIAQKIHTNTKNNQNKQKIHRNTFDSIKNRRPNMTAQTGASYPSHPELGINEMCAICHVPFEDVIITNQVKLKACIHSFCYDCITEWLKHKSECPICKEASTTLVGKKEDGNTFELQVLPEQQKQTSTEEDFSCLDHTYFLNEVSTLLQEAYNKQNSLRPDYEMAVSHYRYAKNHQPAYRQWTIINNAINQLLIIQTNMSNFKPFNVQQTLSELYSLHDMIANSATANYYEVFDDEAEDEYYEYEETYDEHYQGEYHYDNDDDNSYWDEDDSYYNDKYNDNYFNTSSKTSTFILKTNETGGKDLSVAGKKPRNLKRKNKKF